MAIDMHSHWYPQSLVDALQARTGLPYVRPGDDGRHFVQYAGTKAPVWTGIYRYFRTDGKHGGPWRLRPCCLARQPDAERVAVCERRGCDAAMPDL